MAIAADGDAGLGARRDAWVPAPGELANGAMAIPLRIAAAGRRAEDDELQCRGAPPVCRLPKRRCRAVRARPTRSSSLPSRRKPR